jgi:hypothetical protein
MPEKIQLSVSLVNNLLAYLGTQPYQSVAAFIAAIQQEASPQLPVPVESEEE